MLARSLRRTSEGCCVSSGARGRTTGRELKWTTYLSFLGVFSSPVFTHTDQNKMSRNELVWCEILLLVQFKGDLDITDLLRMMYGTSLVISLPSHNIPALKAKHFKYISMWMNNNKKNFLKGIHFHFSQEYLMIEWLIDYVNTVYSFLFFLEGCLFKHLLLLLLFF